MRVVYIFLAVIGLTKALPVEELTKLDLDTIKEALTKLNENDIKEAVNKLYVDKLRDSVNKIDVETIKEQLLDSNGQYNGPIETIILQVLEILRGILVNGTDTIPVLDPITIDRIHIGDDSPPLPSYITINNLIIKDISTFEVEELKLSTVFLRQRLDFNVVIPAINVNTGGYDLSFLLFGGPIYGKGDMRVTIVKPRVYGHLILGVRITGDGISLTIHECRVQFSLGSFEPAMTGLFNDQTISDFVAAFLRNLVPEMLEFFEEDITNILSSITLFVGNLILSELDIGNLLPKS